ncbi:hypothetical protein MAPG_09763 [Magnaporthiopsis poae ATCC 64411]|uniref:C2H2-type domain-containing protein n=1 Tax=Magnaporthiopsis poae (strain ATCC 64411 / 73-15) TaxID=644358 RepID=A0A0C4EAT2_MAGP6|nr:hypothetical protein MAPG_09763 [Magnaporthiopsis poae ATCC 64411]
MAKNDDAQAISRCWHCKICKSAIPKGVSVKEHNRTHTKCETCREPFPNHAALLAHQRSVKHCYCPGCHLHFQNRQKHVEHLRAPPKAYTRFRAEQAQVMGKGPGSEPVVWRGHGDHECGKCHRDYPDADMLRFHCCGCDKVFRAETALASHLALDPRHAEDSTAAEKAVMLRRHACPICLGAFQKLKELRKHIRAEHAAVRCPLGCGETFSAPQDMVSHWRNGRCIDAMSSHVAGSATEAPSNTTDDNDDAEMGGVDQVDDGPQQWIMGLFEEALRRERAVDEVAGIMQRLRLLPTEEPGDLGGHGVAADDSVDAPTRGILDLYRYHKLISRAKALHQRMACSAP